MSNNINEILNRRISRKDFLKTLGLAAVSILGFSSIAGILAGKHNNNATSGFGAGPYGGGSD